MTEFNNATLISYFIQFQNKTGMNVRARMQLSHLMPLTRSACLPASFLTVAVPKTSLGGSGGLTIWCTCTRAPNGLSVHRWHCIETKISERQVRMANGHHSVFFFSLLGAMKFRRKDMYSLPSVRLITIHTISLVSRRLRRLFSGGQIQG